MVPRRILPPQVVCPKVFWPEVRLVVATEVMEVADRRLLQPSKTRLIQRVAKAFQAAQFVVESCDCGSVLRNLALRLEVKLQSGVMTARLEAESPAAKAVLLDNLPASRIVWRSRESSRAIRCRPDGPSTDRSTRLTARPAATFATARTTRSSVLRLACCGIIKHQ